MASKTSGTTNNLSDELSAYQALLEGHRAFPDNDELFEDLCKARAAMEVAWLEQMFTL